MNAQQRASLHCSIDYAKTHITEIARSGSDLRTKQRRVDTQMAMLLEDVIAVLPKAEREVMEECFRLYDRAWHDLPLDPPSPASATLTQQSGSPSSLAS